MFDRYGFRLGGKLGPCWAPRRPQDAPKPPPRCLQVPRGPQEPPRGPKKRQKDRKTPPRRCQEAPLKRQKCMYTYLHIYIYAHCSEPAARDRAQSVRASVDEAGRQQRPPKPGKLPLSSLSLSLSLYLLPRTLPVRGRSWPQRGTLQLTLGLYM